MHRGLDVPPSRNSWATFDYARGPWLLAVTTALVLVVVFSACSGATGSHSSATAILTPLPTPTMTPSAVSPSPTSSTAGGSTGSGTPVNVYVGSSDGLLYSINAATGAKNWSIPV